MKSAVDGTRTPQGGPLFRSRDTTASGPDTVPLYASPALRALVERAARRNAVVPPGLESYEVSAESELALLLHRPDGTEGATQIEQVASVGRWQRSGAFAQRIVGYRSRLSGPNISALALIKQAWIVPILYGNRLGLFLGRDTARTARRTIARDTAVRVVHPFAADRDSVYRFSGGDTALTIRVRDRTIPVAIVRVAPREHLRRRTLLFHGDVYVDLAHAEIVRMRGAFETVGGPTRVGRALVSFAYGGAAFIDLTNREVAGRYWLPDVQRIEGEVSSPFLGDARSVFRVVTRFGPYTLGDATGPAPTAIADSNAADTALSTDTLRVLRHALTIAPSDSLSAFAGWRAPIGRATAAVRDSDFIDVAPEQWRSVGPPRLQFGARAVGDFLHFDRVEGLYTGIGGSLRFRDAAPGLTARAHVGWAWTEQTVRGGASGEWRRGSWLLGAQASRSLANTNDFTTIFTSGPLLESVFLQDDYDYVDRRTASLYAVHEWLGSGERRIVLRVEGGPGDDQGDRARLTHGLFAPGFLMRDSLFRPNRTVLAGTYTRGAVTLDVAPGIDAGFVGEGLGFRLHYEVAGGQVAWQRVDARVVAHHTWGPITALARVDGGLVAGTVIPPQQLFELGATEGLLAYGYKQFAGDQAAIWRGEGLYALPLWQAPLRVAGFYFPSPAPALALGFQSGWTGISTRAARRAVSQLGARVDPATNAILRDSAGALLPVSGPSDGVRTSLNFLIRFFGGAAGVGVAHSLDRGARLQAVVRLGAAL
jgi:hypothetical protein